MSKGASKKQMVNRLLRITERTFFATISISLNEVILSENNFFMKKIYKNLNLQWDFKFLNIFV
jgi:hypothetical protein